MDDPPVDDPMPRATRFAPSPTGRLHLGHAYSAILAAREAERIGGTFLLRIEDIDAKRSRPEFEHGIFEDLAWLGLSWPEPVMRQSERLGLYDKFLHILEEGDLLYPCFCSRADIRREIEASPSAPHGPDGALYPGLCKSLDRNEAADRIAAGEAHALRLHMDRAIRMTGPLTFTDLNHGRVEARPETLGDVVLARKDVPTSYHLSVTVDDALQHIAIVTRGEDLFHATHVHRVLQTLLGLPEPTYRHHPMMLGEDGKPFTKRDESLTLQALRAAGATPEDIARRVGLSD
jgi:glutamyl-Q tRNA(Asp) synthetase